MGARTTTYRTGGGFLDNVDAVITGYRFTDEFNGEPFKPGKNPKDPKKDKFHSLNGVLSVRVDGAEEDVTTTLFVGGFDDFTISEDGHVITKKEGENNLGKSAWTTLMASLVKAGFDDNKFSETENDFTPIIGARVRFVQKTNAEDTKKLGKRKDPKTGREYERKDLVIDAYYGQVDVKTVAGKATGKATTKPAAAPIAEETDVPALTETTLIELLLAAKDKKLAKARLSTGVVSKLTGNPAREAVRKLIMDNDFLNTQNGWTFDGTTVALSE